MHFKSRTVDKGDTMQNRVSGLLIITLIFGLISNGCTALGYGVGYAVDKKHVSYVHVEDVATLGAGDHIRVTMLDLKVIDAIVEDTDDKDLIIRYLETDPKAPTLSHWRTRTLDRSRIMQIEKKQPRTGGRWVFAAIGFVGDVLLVGFAIALAVWAGAGSTH